MCGFPVVLIFILGQRQSHENKMADETIKLDETKGEISKALPFSNNDKDIIDRHVNVSSVKTDSLDKLKDIYEIEKTVEIISKHNYENVSTLLWLWIIIDFIDYLQECCAVKLNDLRVICY